MFLKDRSEYIACYNHGYKINTKYFVIFCLKSQSPARFGITVSNKVGGAVLRNRLKRLLRHFIRKNYISFRSYDFVVVAKKNASIFYNEKYCDLEKELLSFFYKEL